MIDYEPSLVWYWLEFLTSRFFFVIAGLLGLAFYGSALYCSNRMLLPKGKTLKKDVFPVIQRHPMASAVFLGLRYLAFAFFLGCLVLAGASVTTTYN